MPGLFSGKGCVGVWAEEGGYYENVDGSLALGVCCYFVPGIESEEVSNELLSTVPCRLLVLGFRQKTTLNC